MRAGEPSVTARRVARQRLAFPRVPAPYGDPGADQRLQADVAGALEGTASPLRRYLQARTAFVDGQVVGAIVRGVTQLVSVGAGYDGRSLRYAAPGVRWFELDHPDTQTDKRNRLARLGIDAAGVIFVPVDFHGDDVADALARAGQDPARPTVFLCEGVAAYLLPATLHRVLTGLRDRAAAGSALVLELALEPDSAPAQLRRDRLGAVVARWGEPLLGAVPRGRVAPVLADAGWAVERATDPAGGPLADSPAGVTLVVAVPAR